MIDLTALLAYQEAEGKLAQAENAIRSTPSRVKLNQLHKLLKNQQASVAKLNEEMEQRAKQVEALTEQVKKLEERLELEASELESMQQDDGSTSEEMKELLGDIEKLGREMNARMRDVKYVQQSLDKAVEDYQNTRTTAGKAKREYDQLRVVCEKEKEDAAGELKSLADEIERIGKSIDAPLLARYNKVKLHNAQPVAKVVSNKCAGCNMSLPTTVLKKLSLENEIVECENCGRILYLDN